MLNIFQVCSSENQTHRIRPKQQLHAEALGRFAFHYDAPDDCLGAVLLGGVGTVHAERGPQLPTYFPGGITGPYIPGVDSHPDLTVHNLVADC